MSRNSNVPAGRPVGVSVQFVKRSGCDAARYVSDTTVREEALDQGRLVGLYWSAVGEVLRDMGPGRKVHSLLVDPLAYPVGAFELEVDGQALHNHWEWAGAAERPAAKPGTVEAEVELRHQVRPIAVKVVTRLDGTPFLARWLEITNTGSQPAPLSAVSPYGGLLWHTEARWKVAPVTGASPFTLGYDRSQTWGDEGDFTWLPLPSESLRLHREHGKNYGPPTFLVRNEITGELFFLALAWSGNWAAELTPTTDGVLSFRSGPIGPAPLRIIAPGETVASPEVHVGPVHRGLGEAIGAWHRHLRLSVLPPRPQGKEMFSIAGHVVEWPDQWILREIDIAKEMGIEGFMVDAGWYGDVFGDWHDRRGDWHEGSWLPGGLAGVREHAHKQGLLFGLWMEPETVGEKSRIAAEHPDWLLTTDQGRRPGGACVLNLGHAEAARFFEEEVVRVIRDYRLDFFKIDYNVSVLGGGENLRYGYAENEGWRHMEVLYRTFDRVHRELPQVALENCAGGGGRIDLGLMGRFHYACQSDFSHFPVSIRSINGSTLFLPPEALVYYHNHMFYAHMTSDLETHLRVTLFANTVFVGFGAQDADRTSAYFTAVKRVIALAKSFCYPILATHPVVHHHTPGIGVYRPAPWCVLEYAAPDHGRGYAGVFSLSEGGPQTGAKEYPLRLRGVDRSREYEVTLDNARETFRARGRDLAEAGVAIRLDGVLLSELVLYQAVDSQRGAERAD